MLKNKEAVISDDVEAVEVDAPVAKKRADRLVSDEHAPAKLKAMKGKVSSAMYMWFVNDWARGGVSRSTKAERDAEMKSIVEELANGGDVKSLIERAKKVNEVQAVTGNADYDPAVRLTAMLAGE